MSLVFKRVCERVWSLRSCRTWLAAMVAAWSAGATQAAEMPFSLDFQWARAADPQGVVDGPRVGIASGESADFSRDGQYIVTVSKADGRAPHNDTARMRLWDLQGNMLWDMKRTDPPVPGKVDEMEAAAFSIDDKYVSAVGDDGYLKIWQYRDLNTHAVLSTPVLVQDYNIGNGAGGDSLRYSSDGSLLLVGSQEAGRVEVFRVQGHHSTWQFMGKFQHGGTAGQSVNSVDISADGQYVFTAGTNRRGGFWRLDETRDGNGLVTSVNMTRLATTADLGSTTREIRLQPNTDYSQAMVIITAEHSLSTFVYSMQELLDHTDSGTAPPPIQVLRSSLNTAIGNKPEPATFTNDGRFLILTGKTRESDTGVPGTNAPAFFHVYETQEIQDGAPEPDPVYVRTANVFNTEYLSVNPANTQLTSSHHDGSVRLWNMNMSDSETITSEAFNETTSAAGRWTLSGNGIGSIGDVAHASAFRGHRGTRYLAIDQTGSNVSTMTLNQAWDLTGYEPSSLQVRFAAAAAVDQFETADGDFLRLLADLNGDGVFETTLAHFLSNTATAGELTLVGGSQVLGLTFQDFVIDLNPLLPVDFNGTIRFQLQAQTSSGNEEIGFDSLRVTGVIPEPVSGMLLLLGSLCLLRRK